MRFTVPTFALAVLSVLSLAALRPTCAAPPITAAAFSPHGAHVVVGSQAGVDLLAWPDLQVARRLPVDMAHVHHLAFSPDGKTLAIAGGAPREAGRVVLVHWPGGEALETIKVHDDVVYSFAWQSDGGAWATAGADHLVVVHRGDSSRIQLAGHSQAVLAAAFLSGGELLLTAGRDQSIRVWDVAVGELRRTLDNHTDDVRDLAARPNHAGLPLVASAGADRTVRFWQPTIGRMVRFARLESPPLAICWTTDGRLLLAGCADGRLRAVDPDTAAVAHDAPAIDGWAYAVAASPDGSTALVAGENGQLRAVSLASFE